MGTRCVTFVKLPVALSGGQQRELRSTGGRNLADGTFDHDSGECIDTNFGGVAHVDVAELIFLVVRLYPRFVLHQRKNLGAGG